MNIFEAAKQLTKDRPYLFRDAWTYGISHHMELHVLRPSNVPGVESVMVKIQPGHNEAPGGSVWSPRAEDLLAEDWNVFDPGWERPGQTYTASASQGSGGRSGSGAASRSPDHPRV